jgi:hypothetical protein
LPTNAILIFLHLESSHKDYKKRYQYYATLLLVNREGGLLVSEEEEISKDENNFQFPLKLVPLEAAQRVRFARDMIMSRDTWMVR